MSLGGGNNHEDSLCSGLAKAPLHTLSLLIAVLGLGSIATSPKDICSAINIPMVNVIWTHDDFEGHSPHGRIASAVGHYSPMVMGTGAAV
jgi:hypothetical protein